MKTNIRSKYYKYTAISLAITTLLFYLITKINITGIAIIILVAAIVISSFLSLALVISLFTKNPDKTFKKLVDITNIFYV